MLTLSVPQSLIRHDLLLALYCRSQRPAHLSPESEQLFGLEWALSAAIKLAGAGTGASLDDRAVGRPWKQPIRRA